MGTTRTTSKGCKSGGRRVPKQTPLSSAEEEVLHLLTQEFLTPKQVSIRRNCSQQAVSKIISRLKKKGILSPHETLVVKNGWTSQPFISGVQPAVRLHGVELNVKFLFKDERYKRVVAKGNLLSFDGCTVRLYRDSMEVYVSESFYGDDASRATALCIQYLQRLLVRLENELGVIVVKFRSQNIRWVKGEYAEVGNELAKQYNVEGDRLRVYAREDGRLWFEIDNSFNFHEAETKHPQTGKHDMDAVRDHFNDIRDHRVPLPSELYRMLSEVVQHEKEISAGLSSLISLLRPADVSPPSHDEKIVRPDYFG